MSLAFIPGFISESFSLVNMVTFFALVAFTLAATKTLQNSKK